MVKPLSLEEEEDESIEKFTRQERGSRGNDESLTTRNATWRVGFDRVEDDSDRWHEERSERAQTVDEQHNAPLPDTLGQWVNNRNRYDLPGVDTIKQDVEKQRAEQFAQKQQERGAVNSINKVEPSEVVDRPNKFASGAFDAHLKEIRISEGQSEEEEPLTLAHEAGHAADAFSTPSEATTKRAFELDELFDDEGRKERVREDLDTLTERARGSADDRYRDRPNEKIADAAALAVVEPRAARREGGEAIEFLEEEDLL